MCKITKLFEIMGERGIKAKELSEAIGVSTGNISDWKSGRSSPSIEVLPKIANYFSVSTDYLLGLDEHQKEISAETEKEMEEFKMIDKETTLQLATAAIAGGAINFEKEGNEEKINEANIEKIINFYNEMINITNKRNESNKNSNWGAQIFED